MRPEKLQALDLRLIRSIVVQLLHGGILLDRQSLDGEICDWPDVDRSRFRTYLGEADFFYSLLSSDLKALRVGSLILEVGCGIGLLSLMAAEAGSKLIAVEPESSGFSRMSAMRQLVLTNWDGQVPDVTWINDFLVEHDDRVQPHAVEYAFAINVVEHVPDISVFLNAVLSVLRPGVRFRFICPNYFFPYEPHFEIPTFFAKSTTYRLLRKRILSSPMLDAQELWDELSWPTTRSLKTTFRNLGCNFEFSSQATSAYLMRPLNDPVFMERKGQLAGGVFNLAAKTFPRLVKFLPYAALPVIDCTIWR